MINFPIQAPQSTGGYQTQSRQVALPYGNSAELASFFNNIGSSIESAVRSFVPSGSGASGSLIGQQIAPFGFGGLFGQISGSINAGGQSYGGGYQAAPSYGQSYASPWQLVGSSGWRQTGSNAYSTPWLPVGGGYDAPPAYGGGGNGFPSFPPVGGGYGAPAFPPSFGGGYSQGPSFPPSFGGGYGQGPSINGSISGGIFGLPFFGGFPGLGGGYGQPSPQPIFGGYPGIGSPSLGTTPGMQDDGSLAALLGQAGGAGGLDLSSLLGGLGGI